VLLFAFTLLLRVCGSLLFCPKESHLGLSPAESYVIAVCVVSVLCLCCVCCSLQELSNPLETVCVTHATDDCGVGERKKKINEGREEENNLVRHFAPKKRKIFY